MKKTRKERRNFIREAQKELEKSNMKFSNNMTEIPEKFWPMDLPSEEAIRLRVFRNRRFLVQVFMEHKNSHIRLSIIRTRLLSDGNWDDNISWDDLQWIKHAVGYGDQLAVEIFPKDKDIVNVANMRHLWIIDAAADFGWKS